MINITICKGIGGELPPKVERITISIDVAKESRAQRSARIAETQNGRKLRTRSVPSKRRKLVEKAVKMAERGA